MVRRFERAGLQRAYKLAERWTAAGEITGASIVVGTGDEVLEPRGFGRQSEAENAPRLHDEAIFLIASPTKPITALGILRLVEAGELRLIDPVSRYVPEFVGQGKRSITLRHCLTHTSGLPDMVPEHGELRLRGAPLAEFVERVCQLPLDFRPGRGVQYQSMGFLMLGEVVRAVTGTSLGSICARDLRATGDARYDAGHARIVVAECGRDAARRTDCRGAGDRTTRGVWARVELALLATIGSTMGWIVDARDLESCVVTCWSTYRSRAV